MHILISLNLFQFAYREIYEIITISKLKFYIYGHTKCGNAITAENYLTTLRRFHSEKVEKADQDGF